MNHPEAHFPSFRLCHFPGIEIHLRYFGLGIFYDGLKKTLCLTFV